MSDSSLVTIFLTGLFAGGLSCMAVQGGLLTATLAQQKVSHTKVALKSLGVFLGVKLVVYTLLGFCLGWLGSFFQLPLNVEIFLQVLIVIFMLGTALNLLDVHPVFRYFVIQPPRFLKKIIWKETKSHSLFAPGVLGALTIFIPCGATQAMMALAVISGSPLNGAAILFTFILATSPLFFFLGYVAIRLTSSVQQSLVKLGAISLIILAIFNANNAVALTGSQVTLESVGHNAWCVVSYCDDMTPLQVPVTTQAIHIDQNGYTPNSFAIKAGAAITLQLTNTGGTGCTQAFTIPGLGLQKIVPVGKSADLTFTAPSKPTKLSFMCSAGDYRGTITVL